MTNETKSRLKGQSPITGNAWADTGIGGLLVAAILSVFSSGGLPSGLTSEAEARAISTADVHIEMALASRVIPKLDSIADRMLTAERLQGVMASDSPWARERQATMAQIAGAHTRIDNMDRAVSGIGMNLQGLQLSMTRIETLLNKEKP